MARLWTLLRGSILHYIRAQTPDGPTYPYTADSRTAAKADLREYANSLQRLVRNLFQGCLMKCNAQNAIQVVSSAVAGEALQAGSYAPLFLVFRGRMIMTPCKPYPTRLLVARQSDYMRRRNCLQCLLRDVHMRTIVMPPLQWEGFSNMSSYA